MIAPIEPGSRRSPAAKGAGHRVRRPLYARILDDEDGALIPSHALSIALATCWLLVVHFAPAPVLAPVQVLVPREAGPPLDWKLIPDMRRSPGQPGTRPNQRVSSGSQDGREASSVGGAFGGQAGARGILGDLTRALRNVAVAPGSGVVLDDAGSGTRVKLGDGGGGGGTPGRGGVAGGNGMRQGLGAVTGRDAVQRTSHAAAAPPVVAPPIPSAGARDVREVGQFVRARAAQLESCYERAGRAIDPALAGTVHVAITIAGNGAVTGVDVLRRSWSGAGAAAAEACIRSTVRGWTLPASPESSGTYVFPFNFSRG